MREWLKHLDSFGCKGNVCAYIAGSGKWGMFNLFIPSVYLILWV